VLTRRKLLTEHLVAKLLAAGEMSLGEALFEVRSFEDSIRGTARQ
jgi:cell division protease FtsH